MRSIKNYFETAMTGAGVCVLDASIAFRLHPSGWSSPSLAQVGFSQHRAELIALAKSRANHLLTVHLEGIAAPVLVAANSTDRLAERIGWLTGLAANDIQPARVDPEMTPAPLQPSAPDHRVQKDIQRRDAATRYKELADVLVDDTSADWPEARQQAFRDALALAQECGLFKNFQGVIRKLSGVRCRLGANKELLELDFGSGNVL